MIDAMAAHLWQSTCFAGVAALLTLGFRGNQAHVRYCIWLTASYKFLFPFALLAIVGSHIGALAPASVHQISATPAVSYTFDRLGEPLFLGNALPGIASSPRSLSMGWNMFGAAVASAWLCGAICVALIRLRGWRRIRLLVRASIPTDSTALVEVRACPGLLEPGIVGWIRPVLLLPQGIQERLTATEMKAIVAHELCHVRRRDNLLACIHMIVEAIFWFHPLVWWIGAQLLHERERACDEDVLTRGNEPDVYAEAILNVCKSYAQSPLTCVSGITGPDLKTRIDLIMKNRRMADLSLGKKLVLGIAGLFVLVAPVSVGVVKTVWAQEIPDWQMKAGGKMAFEVASVKLSTAKQFLPPSVPFDAGERYLPNGGLFRADFPLWSYIQFAYKLWWPAEEQRNVIDRLPKWVTTDRYSIEARAAGNPTKDQLRLMVQSLLADRFKLAAHFETHEVPVLAVTLVKPGKLGPKLIAHADGRACADPAAPIGPVHPGVMRGDEAADPGNFPPMCDSLALVRRPDGTLLAGYRNVTMDMLAASLSGIVGLGRPLINKTDLSGRFDFTLTWAAQPESSMHGSPAIPSEPTGPGAIDALRDQLGLKLESARGPIPILVIDRVERPSEN